MKKAGPGAPATPAFGAAEVCMVWLKTLIFTIIVPGAIAALIPYLLLSGNPSFPNIGLFQSLGLFPMAIGAAIYLRCAWDFAATGKGTPAPIDPPKRLVAQGLYRFVRNPMYFGVLLALLGEAWLFKSGALLVYTVIAFTWQHLFVVFYEEPALKRKFGESYSDYLARTPRWIPRINSSAR
jgi:protein-S-isoprenylcysteine O-methyltransferase Ste14